MAYTSDSGSLKFHNGRTRQSCGADSHKEIAGHDSQNIQGSLSTCEQQQSRRPQFKRRATRSRTAASSILSISRAFSLLIASSLAGESFVSPFRKATAVAVPSNRQFSQNPSKIHFTADPPRSSSPQKSSQFGQQYVGVEELPGEGNGWSYSIVERVPAQSLTNTTVVEVVAVESGKIAKSNSKTSHQCKAAAKMVSMGRSGQSATYLANGQTVIFVGGQVSNGSQVALTNDIFALNVSSIVSNSTAGPLQPWQQLRARNLPAHAFASRIVLSSNGADEVWLIGGDTDNCSDAAAWTWSASGNEGLNSSWTPVTVSSHGRRSRATPVEVPSANASSSRSSYLLLGGMDASTDCSIGFRLSRREEDSIGTTADLWALPLAYVSTSEAARNASMPTVQTMAMDMSQGEFSVLDYSTVTLPSTYPSAAEKGTTIFFGGLTASSRFASFAAPWTYNPWTSNWMQVPTNGDVPAGRRGHSSTMLQNGSIAIIGGMLEDGSISNDVFTLDLSQYPALWVKVPIASDSQVQSPAKAYHSTVLVEDVLIMAFGASEEQQQASSSSSFSSVSYLDTASSNGWRWSDSIQALLSGRGVTATASNSQQQSSAVSKTASSSFGINGAVESTAVNAQQVVGGSGKNESSTVSASGTSHESATGMGVPSTTSDGSHDRSSVSDTGFDGGDETSATSLGTPRSSAEGSNNTIGESSMSDQASVSHADLSTPITDQTADGGSSGSSKTGAIVGSLIGAAALATVCFGVYAYKNRKEAQEHGALESDMVANNNSASVPPLPPVSALWFNNIKPRSDEKSDASLTQAASLFHVSRKISGRKSRGPHGSGWTPSFMQGAEKSMSSQVKTSATRPAILCDDPLLTLEYSPVLANIQSHLGPKTTGGYPRFGASSDSLANEISDGEASHFSYPYLAGMHRPSLDDMAYASSSTFNHRGTPASSTFLPTSAFCTPNLVHGSKSPAIGGSEMGRQQRSNALVAAFMNGRSKFQQAVSTRLIVNQGMSAARSSGEVERRNAVAEQQNACPFDDIYATVPIEDDDLGELGTNFAVLGSEPDSHVERSNMTTSSASCSTDLNSGLAQAPTTGHHFQSQRVFSDGAATVRSFDHEAAIHWPSTPAARRKSRVQSSRKAKRSQLRVMNPSSGAESDA